ncbi:MAG: arginase family protein [Deltaproteobacteria bacterium]|uniref:Arginase n=1 Tax=Candidatus Zymogenus saltonus TaxID=2844893 RepID=A0A9D8KE29_9DELT|nr:arginase family protein [Candidatus Zymogenus saltonus]
MTNPSVTVDLEKIEENARAVTDLCGRFGIEVFGVTKVTCGMPQAARAMIKGGVVGIGESRMENVRRLKVNGINAPIMLLRIPSLSEADEVVVSVDISLNSELSVIRALSEAGIRRGIVHDIILMVDLGDLREGIWPDDLIPTVKEVALFQGVRIVGLGTNLSCYGGVIPTRENMGLLVDYADEIERRFGIELKYISGGNSSALTLISEGGMPKRVNNMRIGEAILLGRETIERRPWPGTAQDAFMLKAEVIELKDKPGVPIGEISQDAFGHKPAFDFTSSSFKGAKREMARAILNVGREDVEIEGLFPVDDRLKIIGASSDHLIVDVTTAKGEIELGMRLGFLMNYASLLAAMTSSYVEKQMVSKEGDLDNLKGVAVIGVPSWVGSLSPGVRHAPRAVRDAGLVERLKSLALTVDDRGDVRLDEAISGGDYDENVSEIVRISEETATFVEEAIKGKLVPLILGGDDTASFGVFLGLARIIGPFGLMWLDAHGDFKISGKDDRGSGGGDEMGERITSSVLAHALGFHGEGGNERLFKMGGISPKLSPENVAIIGLRDIDQEEADLISESGIRIFTMEDIDNLGMKETIYQGLRAAGSGTGGIYVSLGMDVVDSQVASGVDTPIRGGITYRETHLAMELVAQSGLMVALGVVGINPERDADNSTAQVAVEFILSAFGKKIVKRRG